jgi:hypothetical protein
MCGRNRLSRRKRMRLLQIVSPFQNLFDARAKVAVESSVDYRDASPPGVTWFR